MGAYFGKKINKIGQTLYAWPFPNLNLFRISDYGYSPQLYTIPTKSSP